jgi:hypothetical protein
VLPLFAFAIFALLFFSCSQKDAEFLISSCHVHKAQVQQTNKPRSALTLRLLRKLKGPSSVASFSFSFSSLPSFPTLYPAIFQKMVNAAKVLQDLRASAERKPDVVVRLGKPLIDSGAVLKLDADGKLLNERAGPSSTGRTLFSQEQNYQRA